MATTEHMRDSRGTVRRDTTTTTDSSNTVWIVLAVLALLAIAFAWASSDSPDEVVGTTYTDDGRTMDRVTAPTDTGTAGGGTAGTATGTY